MVDAVTNNRNLTQPLVGGDSGTWGGVLNSGVMGQLDTILGATQAISISSTDITLTISQWNNAALSVTGALTGNHNIILPYNANSSSVAVGGLFVVANNTSGAFNLSVYTQAAGALVTFTGVIVATVLTASSVTGTFVVGQSVFGTGVAAGTTISSFGSGSGGAGTYNLSVSQAVSSESMVAAGGSGVTIPQGTRAFLWSDTVNVWFADDARFQFIEFAGNPNTFVAGNAGTAIKPPSVVWDYTDNIQWFCTTTGNAATAVWTNIVLTAITANLPIPALQGYLTPVSNTPIIVSDSIAATVIYYTPYIGAQVPINNGTAIIPYLFSQMQLTLSTSQAANNIYDVYLAYNGGAPVIGTGPSWTAGSGGSVTAGSCARGTGAGGAAISRSSGLWTNTVSISLIYNTGSGNNTIAVSAGQAILLGSIFIDATAGQVTSHRSWGQSRKQGISNAYNNQNIILQVGDSTATWSYGTATRRASNNNTANSMTTFSCLSEQVTTVTFTQYMNAAGGNSGSGANIGIGYNSTTAASGTLGQYAIDSSTGYAFGSSITAAYVAPPSLGINVIYCTEDFLTGGVPMTFSGTQIFMSLQAEWRS